MASDEPQEPEDSGRNGSGGNESGGNESDERRPAPLVVSIEHDKVPRWIWRSIAIFWLGWIVVYLGTGAVRALRSLLIVLLVSLFLSFAIEPAVTFVIEREAGRTREADIAAARDLISGYVPKK